MNVYRQLLRNPSYVVVWIAQAASGLGSTFALFLISWLMYDMTGSTAAMGSIWMVFMIASFCTNLIAGPFIDRMPHKFLMIISESTRALTFLYLLLMYTGGNLAVWQLFPIVLVIGIAQPLFRPVSMAYVVHIVKKGLLTKANSLLEGTMQLMMLTGPALGGFVLSFAGPAPVLIVLITALGLSALLLTTVPRTGNVDTNAEVRSSWFKDFREGLQFFKLYPVLFWIGMLLLITNFGSGALQPLLLPFVLDYLDGSEFQYGLLMSSFSAGMVVASAITGTIDRPKNLRRVMLGSLTVSSVMILLLGWSPVFWVAAIITIINGMAAMIFTINNTTFYQERVPEHVRGRVFAVRTLMAQGGIPLGAGIGGVIAEGTGIPLLFSLIGLITLIALIIAWRSSVFYQLNESMQAEKDAAATKDA
ncbi:MFS transporter [Salisediminibacterium halotolerans]|uniref:Predicted arabinose efflux permease, MFS family n=1 Tax=Salisediminibacterium halotolerans TaxID=517425 RepID=A0A1H9WTV9_9BACI|nr:MFS transporter [Salisediminibacterium haloalkalitolerans]SES37356.1 Predicted arabinose efflux permease, MFS family [Salisediminibacterium haloalkalitolerans]